MDTKVNWAQILTATFTGLIMLMMLYITVSLISLQHALSAYTYSRGW